MPNPPANPNRRYFLGRWARIAVSSAAWPLAANAARASVPAPPRELALDHTHTRERISLVYAAGDQYLPQAMGRLNHFLRDHYSGLVGNIDPQLMDLLHRIRQTLDTAQPFQVISAYRSPVTNQRLRSARGGGVATRSLHMEGKAIDIRIAGVPLDELRDAALSLKAGGVGAYARDQFVHVDTGRPRSW
jgi:uncharacterized protein YcbK (DUF882 family)